MFVRINPNTSDTLYNSKFIKKVHNNFFLNWNIINCLQFFFYIFNLKFDNNLLWFNHLKINNFSINIVLIMFFISLLVLIFIKNINNSNNNYNIDYFSSLLNLIIIVPVIFLSNNMYTFLFILELISLIIMYKFSVSRTNFNTSLKNKNSFTRLLPKAYLNMLFFQYWANFFSSMVIMFSIFNIFFLFGSLEWLIINLLTINSLNFIFYKNILFIYIWLSFIIGMFFKIGLTPLHLFKIEVYKGLPFVSMFFYTVWYFISFFLYFLIIIFYNVYNVKFFFNFIIFLFLIIGLFYTIFLLFDVNLLKSFFAYSTIVNVVNFIIVLLLILN